MATHFYLGDGETSPRYTPELVFPDRRLSSAGSSRR